MNLLLIHSVCLLVVGFSLTPVYSNQNKQQPDPKADTATSQEYCLRTNSDPFEANCLKNEVIIMKSAIYGRMRIGRCLVAEGSDMLDANRNDPRFLGCSVDVLQILDKKCSGRNRCEIRGTDDDLERQTPCYAALNSYLEADYECAVVTERDRSCLVTVSGSPMHVKRSSGTKLGCGTKSQPWMLEAPAGQQINISLLGFGSHSDGNDYVIQRPGCEQYGYIYEKSGQKNISICRMTQERETFIYTSLTNVVEMVLNTARLLEVDESPQFLMRFSAIGCSNIIPPDETWMRRDKNEATVGCYSSRQTWQLRCVENQWTGVIGNCTRELREKLEKISDSQHFRFSTNYELMVILAVTLLGLAFCLVIICVGVVCWKRYYAKYQKYSHEVQVNGEVFPRQDIHQKMLTVVPSES